MKNVIAPTAIFMLLAFASSAYAESNEIPRLKAEMELLRAKYVHSTSEIAQLKAEIAGLRANEASDGGMHLLEEEMRDQSGAGEKVHAEGCSGVTNKWKDENCKNWARLDLKRCDKDKSFKYNCALGCCQAQAEGPHECSPTNWPKDAAAKTCPGERRCQDKCFMNPNYFDKQCVIFENGFKQQTDPKFIKPVGTSKSPSWNLYSYLGEKLGTISCPCSADGKTLSEMDATRRIVGQVAAMGLPDEWIGKMCEGRRLGRKSWTEAMWNAKVTLSTITMLKCWTKKCSGKSSSTSDVVSADAQLSDLLTNEDSSKTNEGAGWDCG